ncbi:MAG: hypothetical protein JST68_24490 [Bacteroidetes bacterium]|nr:hypothetical protein [Bacteroidota bacterium]
MAKDKRYGTIKKLIEGGHLNAFREIFDTLPKSIVVEDLGTNGTKFNRMINDVMWIRMEEARRMAELLEVEGDVITDLIWKQYNLDKKSKKKKP